MFQKVIRPIDDREHHSDRRKIAINLMRTMKTALITTIFVGGMIACNTEQKNTAEYPEERGTTLGKNSDMKQANHGSGGEKDSTRVSKIRRTTPFVPLDNPIMISASNAEYLSDEDIILGLNLAGQARAYPIRMVQYHHIVNDTVAGRPVLVTY